MKTKRTELQDKLIEEMEKDIRFFGIGKPLNQKQVDAYRKGYQQAMGRALNITLPYDIEEWEKVKKLQEVA